jgi:hypothetical protein
MPPGKTAPEESIQLTLPTFPKRFPELFSPLSANAWRAANNFLDKPVRNAHYFRPLFFLWNHPK